LIVGGAERTAQSKKRTGPNIASNRSGRYLRERGVLGDAANIASRLQAIVAPGDILIFGTVRDIAGSDQSFAFEHEGDQNLKISSCPCASGVVFASESPESGQRRVPLFERAPVKPVVEIEIYRATGGPRMKNRSPGPSVQSSRRAAFT
jgi:hypothetical protein